MITVQRKVRLGQKGRKKRASGMPGVVRVPRVARLMALAIRFDQLIRDGVVADQAELARLGNVTRARVTQIMNLLALTADIQEELLFLSPSRRGREVVTERSVRPLTTMCWKKQRDAWKRIASHS